MNHLDFFICFFRFFLNGLGSHGDASPFLTTIWDDLFWNFFSEHWTSKSKIKELWKYVGVWMFVFLFGRELVAEEICRNWTRVYSFRVITPPKTNVDTQNSHIWKEIQLKNHHFWVSLLDFGCVHGSRYKGSNWFLLKMPAVPQKRTVGDCGW